MTTIKTMLYDPRLWLLVTFFVIIAVGTRCGDAYRP
jgi:hypothetical protein